MRRPALRGRFRRPRLRGRTPRAPGSLGPAVLRVALLLGVAGSVVLLAGLFGLIAALVGLGLLIVATLASAAEAPQGSWWNLLALGTALAMAGVGLDFLSDILGGLFIVAGGALALTGSVLGMPERK
ncbi:MAG: hypothetical protein ACR2NA_07780 [Solirubrobacterales bacterium]